MAYADWLRRDRRFSDILVQISPALSGHVFPRLKLRYKQSLVQSVILAGVLVRDETSESFEWVFSEFLSIMGGSCKIYLQSIMRILHTEDDAEPAHLPGSNEDGLDTLVANDIVSARPSRVEEPRTAMTGSSASGSDDMELTWPKEQTISAVGHAGELSVASASLDTHSGVHQRLEGAQTREGEVLVEMLKAVHPNILGEHGMNTPPCGSEHPQTENVGD